MRWIWLAWTFAIVASFAYLEGHELARDGGLTLSQAVVDMLYAWPPASVLIGIGIGILIAHFWWHWVPRQKRVICGQCGRTLLIGDKG